MEGADTAMEAGTTRVLHEQMHGEIGDVLWDVFGGWHGQEEMGDEERARVRFQLSLVELDFAEWRFFIGKEPPLVRFGAEKYML